MEDDLADGEASQNPLILVVDDRQDARTSIRSISGSTAFK
jgi:hypothetical protein